MSTNKPCIKCKILFKISLKYNGEIYICSECRYEINAINRKKDEKNLKYTKLQYALCYFIYTNNLDSIKIIIKKMEEKKYPIKCMCNPKYTLNFFPLHYAFSTSTEVNDNIITYLIDRASKEEIEKSTTCILKTQSIFRQQYITKLMSRGNETLIKKGKEFYLLFRLKNRSDWPDIVHSYVEYSRQTIWKYKSEKLCNWTFKSNCNSNRLLSIPIWR